MRSRRLVTRRTASARVATAAAGAPEVVLAAAILVEVGIRVVEAPGREAEAVTRVAEAAGREEVEEAWAAGEDKAIAAEAP